MQCCREEWIRTRNPGLPILGKQAFVLEHCDRAVHGQRRALHFLQPHAPLRDAADIDARREGRGA